MYEVLVPNKPMVYMNSYVLRQCKSYKSLVNTQGIPQFLYGL